MTLGFINETNKLKQNKEINMRKTKIVMGITGFGLLLGSHVASAEKLLTHRYDLPSGQLVLLKGNVFSTRKIDCQIRADVPKDHTINFVSLHNQNIVNGLILPEGQNTTIKSKIGDHIFIEMESNSELGLTNEGDSLVNIECK